MKGCFEIFRNIIGIFLCIFLFFSLFLAIPLTSLKAVLFPLMQVYGKYWWVLFASKILDPLVKVITLVTLIFLGVNSINVPLSFLLAAIFVSFFAYLFCRISFKKIFKIKPRKDRRLSKEIISYSLPFLFIPQFLSKLNTFSINPYLHISNNKSTYLLIIL